nr:hypothetical protein BdHM001_35420 [Bdellovibrio sp. HM001]
MSRVNFGRNYYVLKREAEAIRDSAGANLPLEGFLVSKEEEELTQLHHSILEVAEILGISKTAAAEKFKSVFRDDVIEMDDGTKLIHRDVLDRYAESEGIDVNEISFMVRLPREEKRKLEKYLSETGSSIDSWLLKQVQNLK